MSSLWKRLASEEYRYGIVLAIAHFGWWGTLTIVLLRATETIPPSLSNISTLTVGLAVAATLSLSRMRLATTITKVFQAGLTASVTLAANALTDACIVSLSEQGIVESADHADAIGWDEEELVGRELRALLVPHSGGIRRIQPGTNITTPMQNQKGGVFDAKISVVSLNIPADGGQIIATITPISGSRTT